MLNLISTPAKYGMGSKLNFQISVETSLLGRILFLKFEAFTAISALTKFIINVFTNLGGIKKLKHVDKSKRVFF